MTDAATGPLTIIGEAGAACEGDACEIPEHHEQAIVNRRLDFDSV
jgi:hypothetical protein